MAESAPVTLGARGEKDEFASSAVAEAGATS